MRFLAAFGAVWKTILADSGAVSMLLLGCILYSFFYPLPYRYERVERVPVAVVDRDDSTLSRQFVRMLRASPQLAVSSVDQDLIAAQDRLWRYEIMGVITIPPDFRADIQRGKRVRIQITANGVYPLLGKAVLSGAAAAAGTLSAGVDVASFVARGGASGQALDAAVPVSYLARPMFNVEEGYGSYVVPAVAMLIVHQIVVMGMTLILGFWTEQRRRGERPLPCRMQERPIAGFLALWLAFASIAFVNTLYFSGFAFYVQGYPQSPRIPVLLLFAALFALALTAFGLCIGQLFPDRDRGLQTLLYSSIPLLFLSGFPWPAEAMPPLLADLRWFLPSTAGILGGVAVNQYGASASVAGRELLVLGLHAIVWSLLAWIQFRRRWREDAKGSASMVATESPETLQ
jgi:ABC-2 type transport system permease protein